MFKEKVDILVQLIRRLYNELPVSSKIVYIEGGELTGTSTLTNNLKLKFKSASFSNEPDRSVKKSIEETFGSNAFAEPANDDDFIGKLTEIFMIDRKNNQLGNEMRSVKPSDISLIRNGNLLISDRGYLSSVIYQSGILDEDNDIERIRKNCDIVFDKMKEYNIEMPIRTIVLCTINENWQASMDEFSRRLNKRVNGNEQELDYNDNVAFSMVVNRVYSEIVTHKDLYAPITGIQFTSTEDEVLKTAIETIEKAAEEWYVVS